MQPRAIRRSLQSVLKTNHGGGPLVARGVTLREQLFAPRRARSNFLKVRDLLFSQPLVGASQKIENILAVGLELLRPAESLYFSLKLAGDFLRRCPPEPNIGPRGLGLKRCL